MTRVKILWTPQAKDDLREIKRFIARDAARTAIAFVWRVKASVERLRSFPQSGRVVPELGEATIREILQGDYRVIYRYRDERVEILTVFHGARLLSEESLPDAGRSS